MSPRKSPGRRADRSPANPDSSVLHLSLEKSSSSFSRRHSSGTLPSWSPPLTLPDSPPIAPAPSPLLFPGRSPSNFSRRRWSEKLPLPPQGPASKRLHKTSCALLRPPQSAEQSHRFFCRCARAAPNVLPHPAKRTHVHLPYPEACRSLRRSQAKLHPRPPARLFPTSEPTLRPQPQAETELPRKLAAGFFWQNSSGYNPSPKIKQALQQEAEEPVRHLFFSSWPLVYPEVVREGPLVTSRF